MQDVAHLLIKKEWKSIRKLQCIRSLSKYLVTQWHNPVISIGTLWEKLGSNILPPLIERKKDKKWSVYFFKFPSA